MKLFAPFSLIALLTNMAFAQTPKIFEGLLERDVPIRAEVGTILPPREIQKFEAKLQAAQSKDPKKFREFISQQKPGSPLAYNEVLGLTKEEHAEYLKLLENVQFTPIANTTLMLRQSSPKTWNIVGTDKASPITTLRYSETEDTFKAPSGDLTRAEDIKANPESALGPWTGFEWKFSEDTEYLKTKQNFAIGKLADGKYGVIIYMNQSISSSGSKLQDTNLLIRFPLGKNATAKAKSTPTSSTTPATPEPSSKSKEKNSKEKSSKSPK